MTNHPLDRLFATILSRKGADASASYTAQLLAKGPLAAAKKLGEEAVETGLAAASKDKNAVTRESADLLYHLLVLWADRSLKPDAVWAALAAREGISGLAAKKGRKDDD